MLPTSRKLLLLEAGGSASKLLIDRQHELCYGLVRRATAIHLIKRESNRTGLAEVGLVDLESGHLGGSRHRFADGREVTGGR